MLIQHIFKLFLGITVESHELEPESIASLPPDDGKGDDDRRPGTGRLYMKTHPCLDGQLDVALDLPSGKREIPQGPMA